jgi:hypothetical protein
MIGVEKRSDMREKYYPFWKEGGISFSDQNIDSCLKVKRIVEYQQSIQITR